jgi:hypothetical protein
MIGVHKGGSVEGIRCGAALTLSLTGIIPQQLQC